MTNEPETRLTRARTALFAVVLALAASSSVAAVVTTPVGVRTGPGSDPLALDTWQRVNVRTGSSAGITADYPNATQASGLLTTGSTAGKADWQYLASTSLGPLSSFTSASYQWYRDGASTVAPHFSPVFRILVDIDGNLGTTTDRAWIVYERGAIDAVTPVTTNDWVTETIVASTHVWVSQAGSTNNQVPYSTMADFINGTHVPEVGGTQITGASQILGLQVGIGSGWAGTFRGAVDQISVVAQRTLGPDNFELTAPAATGAVAVPTLDFWGLLGSGSLLAGLGLRRQRRRG